MNNKIYTQLVDRKSAGLKSFAVLIDPDEVQDMSEYSRLIMSSVENKVDFFFLGGSLVMSNQMNKLIKILRDTSQIPVVLFPGSNMQIDLSADAILFLSLISGRNPELLIGQHVVAAPVLKKSNLEILPTGYMLVDSGQRTTAQYMSNSSPIPHNKPSVAACTAMAGEMLGLRLMYLDAGSGAQKPVSVTMIKKVSQSVEAPLIVGGGIRSAREATEAYAAGADLIVIGNGIETNPGLLIEVSNVAHNYNQTVIHQ